ncbi:hypothetical protein EDD16DRAFT_1731390 [Pisolithus croceorrhizus]|nr:hypothetical protein EDD16DRAFT_1731390 [Pisolithus croceorrhizus]
MIVLFSWLYGQRKSILQAPKVMGVTWPDSILTQTLGASVSLRRQEAYARVRSESVMPHTNDLRYLHLGLSSELVGLKELVGMSEHDGAPPPQQFHWLVSLSLYCFRGVFGTDGVTGSSLLYSILIAIAYYNAIWTLLAAATAVVDVP